MFQEAKAEKAGDVEEVLDAVRVEISASDDDLRETRRRRDLVRNAAESFEGVLRTFNSGSVAHGTANNPVNDADGGVVLNRVSYPDFGPDSDEEGGPNDLMEKVRDHVMAAVRREYPKAVGRLTKRAILIEFKKPNSDGVNATVNLVVALTRKDAVGLSLLNCDTGGWDASHPEEHTRLLVAKPKGLRVLRARVIRLAKAAIKKDSTPALISFNVEALALDEEIMNDENEGLVDALQRFFDVGADEIKARYTEDPAGVLGTIKLPEGMTRSRSLPAPQLLRRQGPGGDRCGLSRGRRSSACRPLPRRVARCPEVEQEEPRRGARRRRREARPESGVDRPDCGVQA